MHLQHEADVSGRVAVRSDLGAELFEVGTLALLVAGVIDVVKRTGQS